LNTNPEGEIFIPAPESLISPTAETTTPGPDILQEPIHLDFVQTLKDSATHSLHDLEMVEVSEELKQDLATIPDKLEFKIGEVADLIGVKPYVLRYWESEFEGLKPKKSKHNQRMYSHKDVEQIFMIKQLLYRDRFSIEGAQAVLKKLRGEVKKEMAKEKEVMTLSSNFDRIRSRAESLIEQIRRSRERLSVL
jgi:DNA-binding transcriptional MerR regulator